MTKKIFFQTSAWLTNLEGCIGKAHEYIKATNIDMIAFTPKEVTLEWVVDAAEKVKPGKE